MAIKINKSNIKGNTIIFIAIIAFITIFKAIFQEVNTVVGVTVVTAALVLLQRDLTKNPMKNLIGLILFNTLMGVFCYLSVANLWLGLLLNFVALFAIGYLCSSNLKTPVVIPFGLQYLFMLFEPVQGKDFAYRILALIFGAFFIMFVQYIANGSKVKKAFKPIIISVFTDLENSLEGNKIDSTTIFDKLDNLKKMIVERRKKNYYLSEEGKVITDIIWALERVAIISNENKIELIKEKEFKEYLIKSLKLLGTTLENEDKDILKNNNYEVILKNNYQVELKRLLKIIETELDKLWKLDRKASYKINEPIPVFFNKLEIFKKNFKFNSLRVSYALRLAIIGVITIFIVQFFNLQQGKWMAYTIFSLIQPYAEHSKTRMKERIEGTLIGAIIIVVLFFIVKSPAARALIILAAGYLNPFAEGYKSLIILVTMSSVASVAVTGGTLHLALTRVFFVISGALLAFLGSKYVIPYNIKDGNAEILEMYNQLNHILTTEVQNDERENTIKSLYLVQSFFKEKIKSVNTGTELDRLMDIVNLERVKINEIYYGYINLKEKEVGNLSLA